MRVACEPLSGDLSGSRQQFAAWLVNAPRVNDKQVAKANLKALLQKSTKVA